MWQFFALITLHSSRSPKQRWSRHGQVSFDCGTLPQMRALASCHRCRGIVGPCRRLGSNPRQRHRQKTGEKPGSRGRGRCSIVRPRVLWRHARPGIHLRVALAGRHRRERARERYDGHAQRRRARLWRQSGFSNASPDAARGGRVGRPATPAQGAVMGCPTHANREDVHTADLVVWATIGFHHVTRPEDWPVMTTVWQGLILPARAQLCAQRRPLVRKARSIRRERCMGSGSLF